MSHPRFVSSVAACITLLLIVDAALADWPQWRGPNRDGVATDATPIANAWPSEGLSTAWESEPIPGDRDGGHGSVVVADGRAYLSLVWFTEEAVDERKLDERTLRQLGMPSRPMPAELQAKVEATRREINPRKLRGSKLTEFIKQFIEENLDSKELRKKHEQDVQRRLKDGRNGIDLAILKQLAAKKKETFPTPAKFEVFLDSLKLDPAVKQRIIAAVPKTKKAGADVIICLDAASGKTLWKSRLEGGHLINRKASSTPAVAGGKVYAVGTESLYCIDAKTGDKQWSVKLPTKGIASSPMVVDGRIVLQANALLALDANDGKTLWEQKDVRNNTGSPNVWRHDGKAYIICNSMKDGVACVDLKDGKVLWTAPGGGNSTPVVAGDQLLVYGKGSRSGLMAYTMTPSGAKPGWAIPMDVRRYESSPIVHEGHAYLMGGGYHLCVNLATGKVAWKEKARSEISSPVLVDGKVIVMEGSGRDLAMVKASPDAYSPLARSKIGAMRCPSPAYAKGKLYIRTPDGVRAYDLQKSKN